MKKYDDIVVGSGVSGSDDVPASRHERPARSCCSKKAPHIGGSLLGSSRNAAFLSIPDSILRGGLHHGGILSDILSILGIRDSIEPVFLSRLPAAISSYSNREGKQFDHPSGVENIKNRFKEYFPGRSRRC